jgi:excinuclease ABC subunit C
MKTEEIQKTLAQLPLKPGVYIMKNRTGEIIYIGKSRSLKKRVRSYFSKKHKDTKTGILVSAIEKIEFIVTKNEVEALILENNLIKKHKPRYNIQLKDSKTHPYIRVTLKETFPRLEKVRKVFFKDGNLYFGPFPNEYDVNRIVDLLSRNYKLCTSKKRSKRVITLSSRPCLKYHLGFCQGVCMGKASPSDYRKSVEEAVAVLSGKNPPDYSELERQLQELIAEFRYEEAADLRDTLKAFRRFYESQTVEFTRQVNSDFWGISETPDRLVFSVFFVRAGKLLGNRILDVEREPDASTEQLFGTIMSRFYDSNLIPTRIYASIIPDTLESMIEVLSQKINRKVRFIIPKKGEFRKVLEMADRNAIEVMKNIKAEGKERVDEAVIDLQKQLNLPALPYRIECVDISHIQGTDPVASLVTFENGKPKKSEYRLFHIKEAMGGDDPASIAEVTRRRFKRQLEEGARMCDLYIVDGGLTQVRAAARELKELEIDIPIFGLAKREELLVKTSGEEIKIPFSSKGMQVVIKLRNEAHRFANSFQKKTHTRATIRTALLNLPGVGPATIKKLIWKFGSMASVAKSTPEEISKHVSIPLKTAKIIFNALKKDKK